MYKSNLIIDATVHAFNFLPTNYQADFLPDLMQMLYQGAHIGFHPRGRDEYNLNWTQFIDSFLLQPQLLSEVVFSECPTDVMVYHGVPLQGIYKDGSSPTWVAKEARSRFPGRVFIYGPLYSWLPSFADEIDRMISEDGIIGIKFYPVDLIGGELKASRLDTDAAFRCVEHAQSRGIRHIAIHKAVPLGPLPREPFNSMYDLAPMIGAFPAMNFEIVHGGAAFIPETVALLEKFPNVFVNLESLPGFINHPVLLKTWVELMAAFLKVGAEKRLFYASGAIGNHPMAVLDGFINFQMPSGYPKMTDEIKSDILGLNYARLMGWNVEQLKYSLEGDVLGLERSVNPPWSYLRKHLPIAKATV
jgi:uncharacterized protein